MTSDLMTAKEAAASLKVCVPTVYRKMWRGEFGDLYRDGRKCVRIYRAKFDAYVAAHVVSAVAKATEFVCQACGYSAAEKFDQCPECGEDSRT